MSGFGMSSIKIIMSDSPARRVFFLLARTNLLEHIIPESLTGIGVEQNQAHKYDVFEHNVRTLEHAGVKNLRLELRLAALLHDISQNRRRGNGRRRRGTGLFTHMRWSARGSRNG